MKYMNLLKMSTFFVAAASSGVTTGVYAQVFDDVVVVTAQKREQSAQDVGIALTTLSGDQLDQLGFEGSAEIAAHTPGLSVGAVGSQAVTIFNIRGVNQNDFTDHHESPIAVYVDEAYVAAITAVGFQMFDLERVEVLKGPQGTLFGRNTTGGLIHYISAKPTSELEAYGSIQGGSFGQIKAEAALSGPLGDGVAGRLSAVVHRHNGWLENTIGRDRHETDYYGVRGQLLFDIGENAELLVKGHYGKNDNEATGAWVNLVSQPGPDGRGVPVDPTDNAWGGGPGANFFGYRDDDLEDLSGAYDFSGFHDRDVYGGTATLRYNINDNVKFVAISDYRKVEKIYAEDAEGSPDPLINYAATTDQDQFSQEVRLEGETGRLNWIGGVYYLNLDGDFGTKIWDAPDFTSIFAPVPGSSFDVSNEFSQKKAPGRYLGKVNMRLQTSYHSLEAFVILVIRCRLRTLSSIRVAPLLAECSLFSKNLVKRLLATSRRQKTTW